jgi:hypothetical protein
MKMTDTDSAKSTIAIVRAALERSCGTCEPHHQIALTAIAANEAIPRVLRVEASALLKEATA